MGRPCILRLAILLTLGSLGCLGADAEPLRPVAATGSFGAALFRMIGSLALVVALIFAGAWLFRNMNRFRSPGLPRKLQVLETRPLGARQALYVVAFEQQRLLIGSSAQGLTLLTHLPDGEPQAEMGRIVSVSFGEALMQALGRK